VGGGAYLLYLRVSSRIRLRVGALGEVRMPSGVYVYVGSARRSLAARVERHRRLAELKEGKIHWHIDYLLVRREVKLLSIESFPRKDECDLSGKLARRMGTTVPMRGFGSSDCRAGCAAHLYLCSRMDRLRLGPDYA
jgi:Uri superfamily endonuclease